MADISFILMIPIGQLTADIIQYLVLMISINQRNLVLNKILMRTTLLVLHLQMLDKLLSLLRELKRLARFYPLITLLVTLTVEQMSRLFHINGRDQIMVQIGAIFLLTPKSTPSHKMTSEGKSELLFLIQIKRDLPNLFLQILF